ncbi:MAG: DNA-binding response regulator [Deltaproteobacteria bacterium]|jgi:two-component system response regulator YesN|nr:DNA-binding response regulator [Deltaproteobacteria bacterium]
MTETNGAVESVHLLAPKDNVYRVMIADSDPLMRETLSSIIKGIDGFSVTHSIGNLHTAFEHFKRDTPDIVIIELAVPWLTGLDIAKDILEIERDTAIYTISTYDYFEISQFAMSIKLAGHILKPVCPMEITEIFKRHKQFYKLKPSPQLALLSNLVQEKSFGHFYYNLNNIAASLQEEAGRNTSNLNVKLNNIHTALTDLNGELAPSPFPVSEPTLLSIDRVVELCLFHIMNSVFIMRSIKANDRLRGVFSFLDGNIRENIGLGNLVTKCYISQGHLSRLFKKCFNISVMEYIHMRKIMLSKMFFLFTDCTISDVAEQMGYNERSYFSKVFKKFEKMTIQEFRQIHHRADTQAAIAASNAQKFIHEVFGVRLP